MTVLTSSTVGICAYNEEWNIGHLLENILSIQELSADSEVIVVCSGQGGKSPQIVSEFCRRDSRIHLIEEPVRCGKSSAINLIFYAPKGRNIIFISADAIPEHGCFASLITAVTGNKVGIACGKPIPVQRGKLLLRLIVDTLWSIHNSQLDWLS